MIGPTAQVITGAFFWATVVASVPGIFVARVWWFERHVQTGAPNAGEMWKRVGGFAAWLWILNIKSNLFEISDRYMVLLFAGGTVVDNQALVGQLHSSRLFPLLLLGLGILVSASMLPYLTGFWERGDHATVRRYLNVALKMSGVLATGMGAVGLLIAPLIFQQLLRGRYQEGIDVMPITFAYCCMLGLYYIAESYLFCCEKGGRATLALGVGLLVNLAGNALLIPELGLLGAVISTLLGNTVALLILLGMGRRYGWVPGRAVFVCCLLPLSLCLGSLPGLTACGLVLLLGWRGLGLEGEERELVVGVFKKMLAKIGYSTESR